eukprot:GGOE01042535.1.p1 GENE.GGOE01042535.1~~GGOE01042535.1.p1  ORF type:complete len:717 (+),score=193.46 GGOE01042535.1:96-2246(+)
MRIRRLCVAACLLLIAGLMLLFSAFGRDIDAIGSPVRDTSDTSVPVLSLPSHVPPSPQNHETASMQSDDWNLPHAMGSGSGPQLSLKPTPMGTVDANKLPPTRPPPSHQVVEPSHRPRPPTKVEWTVPATTRAPRPSLEDIPWKDPTGGKGPCLMTQILDNQFVSNCNTRYFLIYSITREGNFGLFSVVNQLMAALALAMHMNRTLIFVTQGDELWMYAPKQFCRDTVGVYQPWNCYFMPITNCDVRRDHNVGKPNGHRYTRLSLLESNLVRGARYFSMNVVFGRSLFSSLVHIPPMDSVEELRRLAALATFLFRPVPWIVAYKDQLKRWLGLHQVEFAATHIRRTDKAQEEFLYNSMEYLEMLRQLPQRHVFVMSDDPEAVASLQQVSDAQRAGFQFHSSPQLRPKEGATPAMLDPNSTVEFPVVQHTVEFLADCLIAAEARYFLGYCGSNADRILPELLAARTGLYPLNATSLLLAEGRCRYWARDWARDPTLFSRHTTSTRDIVLAALEDEMLSDREIEAIKTFWGRRKDEGGPLVMELITKYERIVRDPTRQNRIPALQQLKQELNHLMVLTVPKLRAPVECGALGPRELKGKFVFRKLFEDSSLSDSDLSALACFLRNTTSAWEDRLVQLLHAHQEAIQNGTEAVAAATKVEVNRYWCILFPGPLATHCSSLLYAEAFQCGQRPSQKFCAAPAAPPHSIVKLRWKLRRAAS